MSKKLTHPADGHYYLSYDDVLRLNACLSHRQKWFARHGTKKVPITMAVLFEQEKKMGTSAAYWLISKMRQHNRISMIELRDAIDQYSAAYGAPTRLAKLTMDTLLVRAKREGRIK